MFLSTAEYCEQPASAEALMREVGVHLRQARLERGQELEQVAKFLRIRPRYLQALEDGELSLIPGRTYALGFLRSYADYLGFNGNELVVQIRSAVDNLTDRTRFHARTPLPENRLPKAPVLVVSLALVAGTYAGWVYLHGLNRPVAEFETVPEVPADLQQMTLDSPLPGPAEETRALRAGPSTQVREPSPVPAVEAGTGALEEPPSAAQDQPSAEEPRLAAPAQPEADPEPEAMPEREPVPAPDMTGDAPDEVEGADARVVLRARGVSWIRISSPGGDYTSSRTLQPGEAFPVPDRGDLSLWTGNAGRLEVVVDGRTLPPLGAEGRVMREIPLDPAALLARAGLAAQ